MASIPSLRLNHKQLMRVSLLHLRDVVLFKSPAQLLTLTFKEVTDAGRL